MRANHETAERAKMPVLRLFSVSPGCRMYIIVPSGGTRGTFLSSANHFVEAITDRLSRSVSELRNYQQALLLPNSTKSKAPTTELLTSYLSRLTSHALRLTLNKELT